MTEDNTLEELVHHLMTHNTADDIRKALESYGDQRAEKERERLLKLFSHKEYIKRNDLVDALTNPQDV